MKNSKHTARFKQNFAIPLFVLIVGLAITIFVTLYAIHYIDNQSKLDYSQNCNELKSKIESRLRAHAQVLRSAASFFAASDSVTRKEWKAFIANYQLDKNLPGILGVGYATIIPKSELQHHIQHTRNEGFPNYTVKPENDREVYTSIIFIEPFANRNLRAFGYDMFSEHTRRRAMMDARDYNEATLSGKVTLVQETNKDMQAGTLMYLPVYRNGMPTNTIDQRRRAIKGWVYSPYRMTDLLIGILGRWDLQDKYRIHLQIYDGLSATSNSILFDSQQSNIKKLTDTSEQFLSIPLEFNKTNWSLVFSRSKEQSSFLVNSALIMLIYGILISLLIFSLFWSVLNTQNKATKLARAMVQKEKNIDGRFKHMFAKQNAVVLLIDPTTGKIIDANFAAANYYGYSITTLRTMSIDQINTLSTEQIKEEMMHAASESRNYFMFQHKLANQEIRTVEVHSSPIEIDSEKVLFSIVHDITDRILNAEKIRQSELALLSFEKDKEVYELKSRFVANASHEFRTPLATILLANDLMLKHWDRLEKPQIQEKLEKIKANVLHLTDLLNNVLQISRIQNDKMEFNPSEIDFIALCNESVAEFKDDPAPSAIVFESDIESAILWIDKQLIQQLINNLISNGLKYSTENSPIMVRIKMNSNEITFSVQDYGIGIPIEDQKHLFSPFFRATNSKMIPGNGLGLNITQEYARMHDGKITFTSIENEGSTFVLHLPLNERKQKLDLLQ